jgi:hypothetical protein
MIDLREYLRSFTGSSVTHECMTFSASDLLNIQTSDGARELGCADFDDLLVPVSISISFGTPSGRIRRHARTIWLFLTVRQT